MQQAVRQKVSQPRPDLREDALHFRNGTVPVTVQVTPRRRRTSIGDLILRGFIGDKEIEVVFPGRRQAAAVPLLQRLQTRLHHRTLDAPKATPISATDAIREELRVDGAWRVRLINEQDASPERRFQLIAARWRYRGSDGVDHVFGHMPSY